MHSKSMGQLLYSDKHFEKQIHSVASGQCSKRGNTCNIFLAEKWEHSSQTIPLLGCGVLDRCVETDPKAATRLIFCTWRSLQRIKLLQWIQPLLVCRIFVSGTNYFHIYILADFPMFHIFPDIQNIPKYSKDTLRSNIYLTNSLKFNEHDKFANKENPNSGQNTPS